VAVTDWLVGEFEEEALGAGLSRAESIATLPADIPPGLYYLWVILDVDHTAGQGPANEANDRANVPLHVTAITPDTVAAPTFAPAGGSFSSSVDVVISTATPGAEIRYTTDGSTPSESHGTIIASGGSVNLHTTTTLKAIAFKAALLPSSVKQATYVIMEFASVPAGTFQMGDISGVGDAAERPVHAVTISKAFKLGKHEVTQAQWQAIMGTNPSHFTGDLNLPVEQVSWSDCQTFIAALSARFGRTFRLPTEAEWEYACRAGSTTDYYFGNDTAQLGGYAWYFDNSGLATHAVGGKVPSAWGLYDMSGNVWEWCQDWYGAYSSSPQTDPAGPSTGSARVLRGGSWFNFADAARCAYRASLAPGDRNPNIGFRVVME